MDKNPEQNFEKIKPFLEKNNINSILYERPFIKAEFLEKIIQNSNVPIHYLDFDLMYSGFLSGEIIPKRGNVFLHTPNHGELRDILKVIAAKISQQKSIVIIDSLNGFYNLYDEKDSGRLINSYTMLLGLVAQSTDSMILLASMAKIKDKESWVLVPTGRRIIASNFLTSITLKHDDSAILVNLLDRKNAVTDSIRILRDSTSDQLF